METQLTLIVGATAVATSDETQRRNFNNLKANSLLSIFQ